MLSKTLKQIKNKLKSKADKTTAYNDVGEYVTGARKDVAGNHLGFLEAVEKATAMGKKTLPPMVTVKKLVASGYNRKWAFQIRLYRLAMGKYGTKYTNYLDYLLPNYKYILQHEPKDKWVVTHKASLVENLHFVFYNINGSEQDQKYLKEQMTRNGGLFESVYISAILQDDKYPDEFFDYLSTLMANGNLYDIAYDSDTTEAKINRIFDNWNKKQNEPPKTQEPTKTTSKIKFDYALLDYEWHSADETLSTAYYENYMTRELHEKLNQALSKIPKEIIELEGSERKDKANEWVMENMATLGITDEMLSDFVLIYKNYYSHIRSLSGKMCFTYKKSANKRYFYRSDYFVLSEKLSDLDHFEQNKLFLEAYKRLNVNKSIIRPSEYNYDRLGDEYRDDDKEVTAQELKDEFGLHHIQFGNWVENKTRKENVNKTFDSLKDLQSIVGKDIDISNGGTLSIAFGARGKKGASAHYEPSKNIINLTKMSGAGSLAHEWWHSFDHYLGGDTMETLKGFRGLAGELVSSLEDLEFVKTSKQIDKTKGGKAYFGTIPEFTARAFESYVIAKLKGNGAYNNFLATINEEAGVYPVGEELDKVIKLYDEFFDFIAKENSKNTIQTGE